MNAINPAGRRGLILQRLLHQLCIVPLVGSHLHVGDQLHGVRRIRGLAHVDHETSAKLPAARERYVASRSCMDCRLWASITAKFSRDGGPMNANEPCYLALIVSHFQKRPNLVSLFIGELRVGSQ
jgi:hypothetical protein